MGLNGTQESAFLTSSPVVLTQQAQGPNIWVAHSPVIVSEGSAECHTGQTEGHCGEWGLPAWGDLMPRAVLKRTWLLMVWSPWPPSRILGSMWLPLGLHGLGFLPCGRGVIHPCPASLGHSAWLPFCHPLPPEHTQHHPLGLTRGLGENLACGGLGHGARVCCLGHSMPGFQGLAPGAA